MKFKYKRYCMPCSMGCDSMRDKFDTFPIVHNYENYMCKSGNVLCRKCIESLEQNNPDFAIGLESSKEDFKAYKMPWLNSWKYPTEFDTGRVLINTYA